MASQNLLLTPLLTSGRVHKMQQSPIFLVHKEALRLCSGQDLKPTSSKFIQQAQEKTEGWISSQVQYYTKSKSPLIRITCIEASAESRFQTVLK